MSWQFSIHTLLPLITVCCSILLAVIVWQYCEYQFAKPLTVLLLAASWWSLAYFVGLSVTDLRLKHLAHALVYPSVGVVSIAWFVFAIQYTEQFRLPTRGELAALTIVPALTGATALTTRFSSLVWSSTNMMSWNGLELMTSTHGTLFWIHTVQAYALICLGAILILRVAVLTDGVPGSQAAVLIFSVIVPLVLNLMHLSGLSGPIDFTPAGFSLSGAVLFGAVFRDQLLTSLPLACELTREELIDQMSSAVIILDNQERIVDFNPAAKPLATATDTDFRGSRLETVFPEIAGTVASQNGSDDPMEITKTTDGTKKHYQVDIAPFRRGHGIIKGRILTVHDVTERKRHEQELEQERQFAEQTIDALNDVFYVIGTDKKIQRWNESLEATTGYDEQKIATMHPSELFVEDHRSTVSDAIEETMETGETSVEAEFQTAQGRKIPHEFTGSRLTGPDDTPIGLVGIGRDISERKQRERELRAFQEAVEVTGRMIYWMDRDGVIEYANPALVARIGSDTTTIAGERKTPLTGGADQDGLAEEMLTTLRDGDPWEQEFVTELSNGKTFRIDQSVTPVYDGEEIRRFVAIAADITQIWRRNQQLSVLQRVLRHDLRNNLNEILLSVQLIDERTQNDAIQQHLDGIEETVDETLSLSDDTRQFAQTFENMDSHSKVVDLITIVREQVATIRAERPNIEFDVDLPGSAPVVTNDLIDRAIRNVVRNAIQHNDAKTPKVGIKLTRRTTGGKVELEIADNGPGIPDETVEILRSGQETQLSHLSGFGLWLVSWVVSLSGGTLEFANNTPRGTIVKLVLPAAGTRNPRSEEASAR